MQYDAGRHNILTQWLCILHHILSVLKWTNGYYLHSFETLLYHSDGSEGNESQMGVKTAAAFDVYADGSNQLSSQFTGAIFARPVFCPPH